MNLRFYSLTQLVRYGAGDDDQDMVACYVHWALERAKAKPSQAETKAAHLRIAQLLTETVCDALVTADWRALCYVHLKRLMPLLFEMLSEAEYQKRAEEVDIIGQYFLGKKANIF